MDISAEKSRERISNREMDRMERESVEFFDRVRKGYLQIASENTERVVCLDANKSIDELRDEITTKTIEKLNAALG
jgi:dTMP kinase